MLPVEQAVDVGGGVDEVGRPEHERQVPGLVGVAEPTEVGRRGRVLPEGPDLDLEPELRQLELDHLSGAARGQDVGNIEEGLAAAEIPGRQRLCAVEVLERVDRALLEAGYVRWQILVGRVAGAGGRTSRPLSTARLTARRSCGLFRKSGPEELRTYIEMVKPGVMKNRE